MNNASASKSEANSSGISSAGIFSNISAATSPARTILPRFAESNRRVELGGEHAGSYVINGILHAYCCRYMLYNCFGLSARVTSIEKH